MAVRDDFAPGEVLTAGDLNDTFASKADASAVTGSNLLYNGAMQVAARGTSTSGITAGGYYTADRWIVEVSSLGTWTQSVEADGPTGSGLTKSLKMLCTTADAAPAAGDYLAVAQYLEGQDVQRIAKGTASAQQVTLSFWVKSNVTGTYTLSLFDADTASFRQVSAAYTITASGTWEKKTITFPADTVGPFDNDNNGSLRVYFALGAGSTYTSGTLQTTWAAYNAANRFVGQTNLAAATNNYWQVTGVQLEVGPVATGFEFKSYGQELAECQRYYYMHASGISLPLANGFYYSSSYIRGVLHFPVTMRTAPVLIATSGTDYYNFLRNGGTDTYNSLTLGLASTTSASIYNDAQVSGTAGQAGEMYTNNASSSVAFSAEL